MSNSKSLSDSAWKDLASKNKIKDNGLLKELAAYKRLDDDAHDDALDSLDEIRKLATQLKKAKDVAAVDTIADHLADMLDAAESDRRQVIKAKTEADKKAKADAQKKAKAAADAKKQEQDEEKAGKDDDDDDDGTDPADSLEKLARLLHSLKTSSTPYHFLVCDAKPYGLVLAKRSIKSSSKHKKELAEMAGGNTRQAKFGTCMRDGNKLILEMDKPVPGLARVLQQWLKTNIGIPLKVSLGDETTADDEV